MSKRKKLRFRCPVCNMLSWESRLNNRHPLELVKVKSNGRGMLKHLFFDWDAQNPLRSVFKSHFYDVLEYLLRHKYIDASIVKELAELYLSKARDVFHPDVIFKPDLVYNPGVVYHPNVVD